MIERPTFKRSSDSKVEASRVVVEVIECEKSDLEARIREAGHVGVTTLDLKQANGLALSQIDDMSKCSLDYTKCIGGVFIGRAADGRNLSFIMHFMPTHRADWAAQYQQQLGAQLSELSVQIVPGTLTAALVFGEAPDDITEGNKALREWFDKMNSIIAQAVEQHGVTARRVGRANLPGERGSLFLDTEGARLYITYYK